MTAQLNASGSRAARAVFFFKFAFACGVLIAGLEIGYLLNSPLPYDPVGYLVGRDFVNTWAGAKAALTGNPGQYFGFDEFNALLREHFGADYPWHIWSYPPHLLLFTWPLGFIPYMPAYVLYCVLGGALYVAVVADGERRWDHLVLLVFAPAVTMNVWTGQNGFLTAALLIGGLIQLDRRPFFAGVLFGILSIKPQLGFLLPVMLALTGRWRTIAAAAATIAVLAVVTCIAFGPKVWVDYMHLAMPVQKRAITHANGFFLVHMPTVFMNMRLFDVPLPVAIGAQAVMSAVALAAVVWTFWQRRDPVLSMALFVTATFLVTPYAFNYDMVAFGWVIIRLMDRSDNDAWDYGLMLAMWIVPFATVLVGVVYLPGSFLPILAFTVRLVWRLRRTEQSECASGAMTMAAASAATR
jgi:alpha-1,2-mannosyltransferase